jgi:hypothetical protein
MPSDPKQFIVTWADAGREPQCAPNPDYPDGIDLDASEGATQTCTVVLPYPAKRCGQYIVTCRLCGYVVMVTTAGRPDDPKSLKMPCWLQGYEVYLPGRNKGGGDA